MRRIASHHLIDRGQVLQRPLLTLDDEGTVLSIEQWDRLDVLPHTEFYGGALCAGFVNAHCHAELSYLHGAIARGTGFGGFARAIGQVRGGFGDDERRQAMLSADARMWSEGVQAVADIVNDSSSFEVKSRSRIIYRSFAELFGLMADADSVQPLTTHSDTSLTPHSTYSLQDAAFREAVVRSGRNPLSIHFMESPDEQALYRGEGSLAEWYRRMGWQCDFLHYGSPVRRLVESVGSDRRVLLVHNCCIVKEDIDLIEGHFHNPVAWVVCPRSNDYISGLRPPTELLRRHEAMICIGTDSLASNESLSMIEEMKMFSEVPFGELLAWATINGARALGLDAVIGSVEVGKRPGVVLIEGLDEGLQLTPATTTRRLA